MKPKRDFLLPGLGLDLEPIHGERQVRTWDLVQEVSGPVSGPFPDWPNSLKDQIFAGMAALEQRVKLPLQVTHAHCEREPEGNWFVHVIVQYIPQYVRLQ